MGFGSYDETEQENNEITIEDGDQNSEGEHLERQEGSLEFEGLDSETMLDQFKDLK